MTCHDSVSLGRCCCCLVVFVVVVLFCFILFLFVCLFVFSNLYFARYKIKITMVQMLVKNKFFSTQQWTKRWAFSKDFKAAVYREDLVHCILQTPSGKIKYSLYTYSDLPVNENPHWPYYLHIEHLAASFINMWKCGTSWGLTAAKKWQRRIFTCPCHKF